MEFTEKELTVIRNALETYARTCDRKLRARQIKGEGRVVLAEKQELAEDLFIRFLGQRGIHEGSALRGR